MCSPHFLPMYHVAVIVTLPSILFCVDAKGNTALVSGTFLPIDVWSNNGVKYFVEFNDLCQPIRKGGHILIRFIGMMAKMETIV
ncbi:Ribosomal RNA small subunit methyltransferase G [Bienertia sinuspersici]